MAENAICAISLSNARSEEMRDHSLERSNRTREVYHFSCTVVGRCAWEAADSRLVPKASLAAYFNLSVIAATVAARIGSVLAFEIKQEMGLRSKPIAVRPSRCASMAVVPEPRNGSSTSSSGSLNKPMKVAATCAGNLAGCQWSGENGESLAAPAKSQSIRSSRDIKC